MTLSFMVRHRGTWQKVEVGVWKTTTSWFDCECRQVPVWGFRAGVRGSQADKWRHQPYWRQSGSNSWGLRDVECEWSEKFLGSCELLCRFIPNLATFADPLWKLMRKNERFVFGQEQQDVFQALKVNLMSAQTLGRYNPKARTDVIADASPVGFGAVLVQIQMGEPRITAFASRSLTDVERRYSYTEKEALGLVWACERFHAYLFCIEFELVTEHKPLEVIYSQRSKQCARIERLVRRFQPQSMRWSTLLVRQIFQIVFIDHWSWTRDRNLHKKRKLNCLYNLW